ncbi:hypothetical protein K431DRAFT_285418 [Polychaeton citri CBS 116435]|uniref:KOW domain-containing protein n=1 Tax=Polychaeton citri CBS 116435 TaxID=1314669 RepID=A0A9P4Q526_9PEZI|nr:hypothetical protein K431DRAFT_285418 [Polychaeton citri CBS 116435]
MQRVVQRSQQAVKQAARQRERRNAVLDSAKSYERAKQRQRRRQVLTGTIKDARKSQKEGWELGELAPRRDTGVNGNLYGTKQSFDIVPPPLEEKNRPEWYHLRESDRVVVIRGREKGKIGRITNVQEESGSVMIERVNEIEVAIPKYMSMASGHDREVTVYPSPIPIENVRLVYPLPDPETGILRDVIVDRLEPINREWDSIKRKHTAGERVIPGTKTIIPWPAAGEEQFEDAEDDTLRISVEEKTFRPFLVHPPMPMSVIDELRGKYSKFRTRHDYDFVERMEAIDARGEKRKELIKGMRTPLQELAEKRKEEKPTQTRELSEAQLEAIGRVIAQEKGIPSDTPVQPTAP